MSRLPPVREMERALAGRNAAYDGVFFTAIRTTGVFCRPSCPARAALPRNRRFFSSPQEASQAGYRPCKRCRPLEVGGRPPGWVGRLLAEAERRPRLSDADLRALAIDPARARRHFLKHYGMTFQAYARGRRMARALDDIRNGADLDEVVLGHGYESHSGFREAFGRTFGQPPGRSRGTDCIVTSWVESPVGPLLVGALSEGVCLLEFSDPARMEGQVAAVRKQFNCAAVPGNHEHLDRLREELSHYFAGKLRDFGVPLAYPGTGFQCRVWDQLRRIPYGQTLSYEGLAREVGSHGAQRAVGRANGQNRLAIVIPCHRVVNKDGRLGGYGGGLWRKVFLLDLERQVLAGRGANGMTSANGKA